MPPKRGTLEYERWITTPEYKEFCKNRSGERNINFGGKYTKQEEIRKKMSIANSGENAPCFGLTGEDHPAFGHRHTEEFKKQLSENWSGENHPLFGVTGEDHPAFGYHHTKEHKLKISVMTSGSNNPMFGKTGNSHPNWRGDDFLREYPPIFDELFKTQNRIKFGNICIFPGCCITPEENGKELAVHHYDYNKNTLECVPLCHHHHGEMNVNRDEWEEYFTWFCENVFGMVWKMELGNNLLK